MANAVEVGHAQFIGARGEQQDACGVSAAGEGGRVQPGGVLAVVADGIGGHAFGGEASELAVRAFMRAYQAKSKRAEIHDALYSALKQANAAVCEFAETQGAEGNCGTTLVAAALHPESRALYWISIGDSRLYLLRDAEWVQLTADGNCARQRTKKIARGIPAEEDPDLDENPQVITSFLGRNKISEIDWSIRPFPLHAGDWLVLCTDGLFKTLSPEEIVGCLREGPQAACAMLVRSVAAKGLKNQDNCTVAIVGYELADAPGSVPAPPTASPGLPAKARWNISGWWRLGIAVALSAALLLGGVWLAR